MTWIDNQHFQHSVKNKWQKLILNCYMIDHICPEVKFVQTRTKKTWPAWGIWWIYWVVNSYIHVRVVNASDQRKKAGASRKKTKKMRTHKNWENLYMPYWNIVQFFFFFYKQFNSPLSNNVVPRAIFAYNHIYLHQFI